MFAFEEIKPALRQSWTKLFKPFEPKVWSVLGFIVLVMGGGALGISVPLLRRLFNGLQFMDADSFLAQMGPSFSDLAEQGLTYHPVWIVVLVLAIFFLWLVLVFLGTVFKFSFFEAILEGDFRLGPSLAQQFRSGWSLFVFLGSLQVLLLGLVLHYLLVPFLWAFRDGNFPDKAFFNHAFTVLLFYGAIFGLLKWLAVDFVLPLMCQRRIGLIQAWEEFFWMALKNIGQLAGYGCTRFILAIAGAVVSFLLFIPILVSGVVGGGFIVLVLAGLAEVLALSAAVKAVLLVCLAPVCGLGFLYLVALACLPASYFFRVYSFRLLLRFQQRAPMFPTLLY